MNYMHASIQATLYNAHFDTRGVPWTAEDLLGRGNRAERQRDRMHDRIESMKLSKLTMGAPDEDEMPDFVKELAANRKRVN